MKYERETKLSIIICQVYLSTLRINAKNRYAYKTFLISVILNKISFIYLNDYESLIIKALNAIETLNHCYHLHINMTAINLQNIVSITRGTVNEAI